MIHIKRKVLVIASCGGKVMTRKYASLLLFQIMKQIGDSRTFRDARTISFIPTGHQIYAID